MELREAKRMARELMHEHGIGHWSLRWMDERHTAGTCATTKWHPNPHKSRGIIKLSRVFMEYQDVMEARDTILHEIAHALTNPKYAAHGKVWRLKAQEIGGSGAQYVDRREHAKPQYKYVGVCPAGHKIYLREKANVSCRKCSVEPSNAHRFVFHEKPKADSLLTTLQDIFLGV